MYDLVNLERFYNNEKFKGDVMDKIIEFKSEPNSYWIASTKSTDYPKLEEDLEVDVAIIGGGIVGITTAYLLAKQGVKAAVLEADFILQGTTGHTTAKITSQHSFIYARLIKEHGHELARQYAEANQSAIKKVAEIAKDYKIDCDFSWQPAYLYTEQDKYIKEIEDEIQAARSLGIESDFTEKIGLPISVKGAMRFDNQAQYHPLKFLQALAEEVIKNGGLIFEQTEAIQIDDNEVVITKNGHKVKADKVIIASHYPFFDGGGLFFSRIYQERSYIVGMQIEEKFPEGYFINAETPTRSLRAQPYEHGDLVLVGGEHHKAGQGQTTNTHYQNLLDFAHQTFTVKDVSYRWSTQDCMTIDGLPYVGHLTVRSPNLYVATGFGKWGMSNGIAAAMIISDLIVKGENPWAEIFTPSRLTPASIKSFAIQNVNVAKNLIAGKLEKLPEEVEIERGEAALIKTEGQRIGVYKDETGKLHMVDTTCTHFGCELNWNEGEKSWDCPCHGSRFSYEGEIMHGPAIEPLHRLGEDKNRVEARVFK